MIMHDEELYLYYYRTIGVCNIQHVILARNMYASNVGASDSMVRPHIMSV